MPAFVLRSVVRDRKGISIGAVIVLLASLRLAHVHLLWADEDYHLAAALSILHGKLPYRDFWYDKPPLAAFYYCLIGGYGGWPLRLLDAAYVVLACRLMFLLAAHWWGRAEGYIAAILLAVFTTFYLPSAVLPFAADAVMLVPHLAAIYCASRGWPVRCGLYIGLAFLANAKAIFILFTCLLWCSASAFILCLFTMMPLLVSSCFAAPFGVLGPYWQQVWQWGALYTKGSPVSHPAFNGLLRTANWLGFHSLLAVSSGYAFIRFSRNDRFRLGSWVVLSFAATALGSRFAPHYFLQLLPSLVLCGARGCVLLHQRFAQRTAIFAAGALLVLPVLRFGPHYFILLADDVSGRSPHWSDVMMDLDSQQASKLILRNAAPTDTLFVWGYRPDLYVWTRLLPDGRFTDSQPLTGVPADRHLAETSTIYDAASAAANRRALAASRPTFIADGLSTFNPKLAMEKYPELRSWLSHYQVFGRTALTVIYKRRSDGR